MLIVLPFSQKGRDGGRLIQRAGLDFEEEAFESVCSPEERR
jgi:hypothetical protein